MAPDTTENASSWLTLREAAEQLGVHYMTAYRYVRLGKLAAHKVGAEWRVEQADLEAYAQQPARAEPGRRHDPAERADRLRERLVAGDEPGAWALVEQAITGGAPAEAIVLDLLLPALREIGDRWERGDLSVADEHRATVATTRLAGRLGPHLRRRGRRRGTVVVGVVPGDHHGLPATLLADLLRGRGFEVVDLGADTPISAFADALDGLPEPPLAVLLTATVAGPDLLASVVAGIRAAEPASPILVGGAAMDGLTAETIGADRVGRSALEALDIVEALAG